MSIHVSIHVKSHSDVRKLVHTGLSDRGPYTHALFLPHTISHSVANTPSKPYPYSLPHRMAHCLAFFESVTLADAITNLHTKSCTDASSDRRTDFFAVTAADTRANSHAQTITHRRAVSDALVFTDAHAHAGTVHSSDGLAKPDAIVIADSGAVGDTNTVAFGWAINLANGKPNNNTNKPRPVKQACARRSYARTHTLVQ